MKASRKSNDPLAKALRLLRQRDYFEAELQARLQEAGYSDSEITAVLTQLHDWRLVSDQRTEEQTVQCHLESPAQGRLKLAMRLSRSGIDLDEALQKASEVVSDEDELARAIALIRNNSDSKPDKLYRKLLGRGFSPEIAEEAVRSTTE